MEREELLRANKILAEHCLTQKVGLQVSRRAALERKRSSHSLQSVSELIAGYEREIKAYKHRIEIMEQEEI